MTQILSKQAAFLFAVLCIITFTNGQFKILLEQMEFYKALYTLATLPKNSNDTVSAFFENIPLLRIWTSKCEKEKSLLKNV